MDLFLVKKLIGFLMMPLSMVSILLLIAIVFFHKKPSLSFKCLVISSLLLILTSTGWVADRIMQPLESKYEGFSYSNTLVDYIVILGCGHRTEPSISATSQLFPCSLQRLVEGIRIYTMYPNAHIITSGAAFENEESNAEKVKQAAVSLGVPEEKIIMESFPKDTEEEAELIAARVKGHTVVLVTNADHMHRAVNYFAQQGITVIPAPASPWVAGFDRPKGWQYYLPNSKNLVQSTRAWYEAIGLFVQWLKEATS